LAPATFTKCLRRHASLLAEKSRKMRRVRKSKVVGDFVNRLVCEDKLALGFRQDALADQVSRRDARRALDMIVEPVRRHCQFLGIEADETLLSKMFIHKPPQFINPRIGMRQRYSTAACSAYRESNDFDGNKSKQAAHRQAVAFARER